MTLMNVIDDLVMVGVFLVLGFAVREAIKPLQKLFLPASVIGGLIALALGQQLLGWVTLPSSFSQISGVLINVIMTALIFGISLNMEKARSYLDYTAVYLGLYGAQAGVGIVLGAALLLGWPGMPQGWGVMGVFSFFGGHGTAGAAGGAFADLGVPDALGIGMILSTIGLIVGVLGGTIIVNIGIRKGWATFIENHNRYPDSFYGGVLPADEQTSIGKEKTTSLSVNALALQVSFLFLAMFLGKTLITGLSHVLPFLSVLPSLTYGMVGALILWPIMKLLRVDRYVDRKTISTVNGFLLEVLILTAVATLNLELATTYFVPIAIYSIAMLIMTTFIAFYFSRRYCSDQWFEKAVTIYGAGTGHAGVALMLLRMVDPDSKSNAGEALGVFSGLTAWLKFFPALFPLLLMQGIGWPLAISCALALLPLGLGWYFFATNNKAA